MLKANACLCTMFAYKEDFLGLIIMHGGPTAKKTMLGFEGFDDCLEAQAQVVEEGGRP